MFGPRQEVISFSSLFLPCREACGSYFLDSGLNPHPRLWKRGVLTREAP